MNRLAESVLIEASQAIPLLASSEICSLKRQCTFQDFRDMEEIKQEPLGSPPLGD
jgi:hypothetical protein